MTADRVPGRIVMTVSNGIVTDVSFPCGLDTFMPTLMSGKKSNHRARMKFWTNLVTKL